VRISVGLGLGHLAPFLKKQRRMFWRLCLPGDYSPNGLLVERLICGFGQPANHLRAVDVLTFNELEKTEVWRREWLARLS
jgi:methylenetetrahydrofolate reductase (NADPH)